jgi:GH25 family lysozyme M1 (1,4-beta-N-acetylmuramidase)
MRSTLLAFLAITISSCANSVVDEGETMSAGHVPAKASAFTNTCAAGPTVRGVDVSVYQSNIDWNAVAASGVRFAIIRVSDGTGNFDSQFNNNWNGAKAHGVMRSAYQFFRSNEDPVAQANLLIAHVGSLGAGDLPPVIDVETTDGQSPGTIAARVHTWLDTVQAALGVRPIVYTGPYFWRDQVGGANETASPLFVAHYGTDCPFVPPAWTSWTFHQFTSTGAVPGIPANVDLDVFNGTEAQLEALAHGGSPSTPADPQPTGIVGGASPNSGGYWLVGADGGVFSYGESFFGSMGASHLNKPVVGMATTPSGHGYWLTATDGGIFSFGDAQFFGSTGNIKLNKPVVGMAARPQGDGYWLVASDGGVFSFGNAPFKGSMGGTHLNKPVVGMASTPSGNGYWLVASDGGIFAFGDAPFKGSTGNIALNKPVVGMASTSTGNGYWLVAQDGGIFGFGDAAFHGSMGGHALVAPVTGMAATPSGGGYWLFAQDGGVFSFGDAPFKGSDAGH